VSEFENLAAHGLVRHVEAAFGQQDGVLDDLKRESMAAK
jgi:hypothetical protein